MKIKVDWLSVRLVSNFNLHDLWELAETTLSDNEGVVFGVQIPKTNFRIDRRGANQIASVFHSGIEYLIPVADELNLPVSRIDIAADWRMPDGYDALQMTVSISNRIRSFYEAHKRKISDGRWSGKDRYGNDILTFTFGTRKSDYQIRVYNKHLVKDDWGIVRLEFQLRKKLCKSVWTMVRTDQSQPNMLKVLASLEAKILERGVLPIAELKGIEPEQLERDIDPKEQSNREIWIRSQVLQACIKEFNETGLNLPEILLAEFNQHYQNIGNANAEYQALSDKLAD